MELLQKLKSFRLESARLQVDSMTMTKRRKYIAKGRARMEFTAVEGDEKMVLEDEVFGEGAGRYKEALLCRELPLCLKLMQRDCNVEGWPETGRFEIDTWMRFSALGAYFPSYFGMTFLDSQDESVWVGHRAMQNGSASITVVEKVLIVGDKLSVREWSDECTLQAWHEYVEFIVKTLDLISACLASNVIPWDLKLDNVGVLVHGPFATRQVVIIDLDGLRPCTPQPNKGASASKIIERYVSFLRSCIESNRTMLATNGWYGYLGQLCSVMQGVYISQRMKQATWEHLVVVNNNNTFQIFRIFFVYFDIFLSCSMLYFYLDILCADQVCEGEFLVVESASARF